ncbi:C2 domain-containing protein [Myxozyma melibiosi]|uniref:C2 domain-containing protein n=1 Tax=Myxozyma melibiosi TaxID=54550 RepID=A0ABR1FA54_9ASCO
MSSALQPREIGTLIAVLIKAKNLPNRRTLGKQDPYCTVRIGQNAQSTNVDKRGGQRPMWNHEVRFVVSETDETMKLTVLDDNDSRPELIGDTVVDLKPVLHTTHKKEHDKWHEIQHRSKYAGEIYIEMTFYPNKEHVHTIRAKRAEHKRLSSPKVSIDNFGGVRPLPATPGRLGEGIPSLGSSPLQPAQAASRSSSTSSSPASTPRGYFNSQQPFDRRHSTLSASQQHSLPLMPARSNSQGQLSSTAYSKTRRVSGGSENNRPASRPVSAYSYDSTVLSGVPDEWRSNVDPPMKAYERSYDEETYFGDRYSRGDRDSPSQSDADFLAEQLEKLRYSSQPMSPRHQTPEYEHDRYIESPQSPGRPLSHRRTTGGRRPLPMPPGVG